MSVVMLEGEIVHYEVLGRGRPIIFMHGWIGSWRYWMSSMQVTSTSFRAYAIDLWGFGDSSRNDALYPIDQQVNLVARFMDQMGIGKVALVGHGLGALIGCVFALRYPGSVDRLMAVNCPLGPNALHTRLRNGQPADLLDWLSSRTPAADAALADAPRSDPRAIAASMLSLQNGNLFPSIISMATPCLLVNGQNDPAIAQPPLDAASALPHNMHQVSLDQSGHFPMIDETSKFNRLLTDFLTLASGESPRQLQLKDEWKRRVR